MPCDVTFEGLICYGALDLEILPVVFPSFLAGFSVFSVFCNVRENYRARLLSLHALNFLCFSLSAEKREKFVRRVFKRPGVFFMRDLNCEILIEKSLKSFSKFLVKSFKSFYRKIFKVFREKLLKFWRKNFSDVGEKLSNFLEKSFQCFWRKTFQSFRKKKLSKFSEKNF